MRPENEPRMALWAGQRGMVGGGEPCHRSEKGKSEGCQELGGEGERDLALYADLCWCTPLSAALCPHYGDLGARERGGSVLPTIQGAGRWMLSGWHHSMSSVAQWR
jgi:hypothetical protein